MLRSSLLTLLSCAVATAADATAWCVREADAPPSATVGVIAVCAPDGAYDRGAAVFAEPANARVGARVLWSAPGEPATVLFDCSGRAERYRVEPSTDQGGWQPQAGVQVECRVRPDGPVDTWEQVGALWDKAGPIQGRALIPVLNVGVNPCADTRDGGFLAVFRAWLPIAKGGEYRLATLSDDASFFAVDGRLTVSWGGWHGLDEGRGGQKSAAIRLEPGLHEIEYRYAQNGDNPIAQLAWQPPGAPRMEPIPADAYAPVAPHRLTRVGDGAWFAWRTAEDCGAGGEFLVALDFTAHVPSGCEARWNFDDGVTPTGVTVRHAYARPNVRTVRLTAMKDGKDVATCERRVLAKPRWLNHERWNDGAHQRLRDELATRDPAAMPAGDVLALVHYADFVGEPGWVAKLGAAAAAKPTAWGADGIPLLAELGMRLQDDEIRRDGDAVACWRGLISLKTAHDAQREHIALHLAGLLVHGQGLPDEAGPLLAGIEADKLDATERRLLLLYRGDQALAAGDAVAARARYAEAGDAVPPADTAYAVRRRARLEAVRAWCARGEFEQALRVLNEIEWETPVDRLGSETGLLKIRAWIGRQQLGFALACCRRLLVATAADDQRADVLAALTAVCLAAGRPDDAAAAVAVLGKEFPYSEATARATDLVRAAKAVR